MNAVFITVRSGSRRLPRKALLKINGKATIEHVIDRAKRSKEADLVVLCTTTLPEDTTLKFIAMKNGIECFRGSVDDKLERWRGAAKKFHVERFVTADGDDLLCEPELMDMALRQMELNGADFIQAKDVPCGAFSYAISTAALKHVCWMKDTSDTEMMSQYFTDTGLFRVEDLAGVPKDMQRPGIRITLDYPEDLEFFKAVFGHFGHKRFSLWDVIAYLDEHPEVMAINSHLQQRFFDNQKARTKLELRPCASC
jgi:spore coat polysaccharide biosynthesis protein SpsF